MKQLLSACLFAPFLFVSEDIHARSINATEVLAASVRTKCPALVTSMLKDQQSALLLTQYPIDSKRVCDCVEETTARDVRMVQYLTGDEKIVSERIASPSTSEYLKFRVISSLFSCIAPALNATLEQVELPTPPLADK